MNKIKIKIKIVKKFNPKLALRDRPAGDPRRNLRQRVSNPLDREHIAAVTVTVPPGIQRLRRLHLFQYIFKYVIYLITILYYIHVFILYYIVLYSIIYLNICVLIL